MITTAIELEFADGVYLFDLKLPQMAELQEKRGCGLFAIYGRVLKGRYVVGGTVMASTSDAEAYPEDLFETIRLGLIGGGKGMVDGREVEVSPLRASQMVKRYCHEAPLRESWALAATILGARIEGFEPPKKDGPAKEPAAESQTIESTSQV